MPVIGMYQNSSHAIINNETVPMLNIDHDDNRPQPGLTIAVDNGDHQRSVCQPARVHTTQPIVDSVPCTTAAPVHTRTIHVRTATFSFTSAMIDDIMMREPSCCLFTCSHWNLELRSFAVINNWLCGYDIDTAALDSAYVKQCFIKDVTLLGLHNLKLAYSNLQTAAPESTHPVQSLPGIGRTIIDFFINTIARADSHTGLPAVLQAFNTHVLQHPDLLTPATIAELSTFVNRLIGDDVCNSDFLIDVMTTYMLRSTVGAAGAPPPTNGTDAVCLAIENYLQLKPVDTAAPTSALQLETNGNDDLLSNQTLASILM